MKSDWVHYLSLVVVLLAGVFAFWFLSYDKTFQVAVLFSMAIAYVTWGVIHHLVHKDFYPSVLLEYVSVAVLGLVIILSLILA